MLVIRDVLASALCEPYAIDAEAGVEDAADYMAAHDAVALVVMEGERAVGVFTCRDFLRRHARRHAEALSGATVRSAMGNELLSATPSDNVAEMLVLMMRAGVSVLPVLDEGRLVGVLRLRDMAKRVFDAYTEELRHLQDYIADLLEADKD